MSENRNIFEYFGEPAIDPEKAAVLGVDFGDGELVVVYIYYDESVEKLQIRTMNLTNMAENVDYAVLFLGNDGETEGIGKQFIKQTNGKSYANYKRIPEDAGELYGGTPEGEISLEDEAAEKSYKYLMGKAFGKLIENAINYGNIKEKEIYLFVGRPSSSKWEEQALQYRDILKAFLPKDRLFHIVVISEARAAMANEYRKNRSLSDKTVAIIDGGSSTFDCAVVRKGRVVCEYSRQVGAGMLDRNLLDIYMHGKQEVQRKDENGRPVWTWKKREQYRRAEFGGTDSAGRPLYSLSEGAVLCDIREQKEKYYGATGRAFDGDAHYVLNRVIEEKEGTLEYYRKKDQQSAPIKDIIDVAVYGMPVRVAASYPSFENDEYGCGKDMEYESFAAAVRSFFEGAKAKWTKNGMVPEKIIVTGGATLMPFVDELMCEVFLEGREETDFIERQEDQKVNDRHFSVANGVAYMGYLELYKQKICREVYEEAKALLSERYVDMVRAITNSYVRYRWDCLKKRTQVWSSCDQYQTLDDWGDPDLLQVGEQERILKDRVTVKGWGESLARDLSLFLGPDDIDITGTDILRSINTMLAEKTKDLFPKKNHYTYHLNADDLSNVGNYYPYMVFDKKWFTGNGWHRFWNSIPKDLTAILTSAQKEHMYQYMLDRVDKFKEAIREQYLQDNQSVNEEIRKALEDNLRKSMEKYAEGLTEYMIMEEYNVK